MYMVENFNQVLMEMTKHVFPSYTFHKQKHYLRRHQIKYRSMKACIRISRLQEINPYLGEFPPDAPRQETAPLPMDTIKWHAYL